jgi:hypothetical protein
MWHWSPFFRWGFEAALAGPPDRSSGSHHEGVRFPQAGSAGPGEPTAIDLWLIQLTYAFVAAGSRCSRCDAPLGRDLRVVPSPVGPAPSRWHVSVVTRCTGWRRHRHTAHVARPSKDLLLGALHRGRA